jgi:mRNA interferase MazF
MAVKQFEIWIANLDPRIGSEAGKTRPVVVVQTNLLNQIPHPSTIVCPVTSSVAKRATLLRVHLKKGTASLYQDCDILIDQVRAIDNRRLVKKIGALSAQQADLVKDNLRIILDL